MQGLEGGTSENANRATQGENLSFVTDLWKRVHPGHFLTVKFNLEKLKFNLEKLKFNLEKGSSWTFSHS